MLSLEANKTSRIFAFHDNVMLIKEIFLLRYERYGQMIMIKNTY